jgi:hypothetical protein
MTVIPTWFVVFGTNTVNYPEPIPDFFNASLFLNELQYPAMDTGHGYAARRYDRG